MSVPEESAPGKDAESGGGVPKPVTQETADLFNRLLGRKQPP